MATLKAPPTLTMFSNTLMGKYVLVCGYELSETTPSSMNYLYDHTLPMYDYIERNNRKKIKILSLACGHHTVNYNGHRICIHVYLPHNAPPLMETHNYSIVYQIDITMAGLPDPEVAQEVLVAFVEHCKKNVEERMENSSKGAGKTIKKYIFDPAHEGNWTILNVANKRPIESIFLPKDVKEQLVERVRAFVKEGTIDEYARFNVPYKLNLLLHGLPGTGKTSCIHAIASEINSDIGIIHFGRLVDDTMLTKAINQMSNLEKCRVLVLEDIDSLFSDERKAHDSERNSITLSGLLNCLDGLSRNEGLIIFMTTNRRDFLEDVALSRSCRVDVEIEFKDATEEQIEQMIRYYFPDQTQSSDQEERVRKVANKLVDKKCSTATLQQYFFEQRHSTNILDLPNFKDYWGKYNSTKDKNKMGKPELYM